jgi:hypothetical protein
MRQVVAGFEPTAVDNHRTIVQEWLTEAFTMWGLVALVIAVTVVACLRVGEWLGR